MQSQAEPQSARCGHALLAYTATLHSSAHLLLEASFVLLTLHSRLLPAAFPLLSQSRERFLFCCVFPFQALFSWQMKSAPPLPVFITAAAPMTPSDPHPGAGGEVGVSVCVWRRDLLPSPSHLGYECTECCSAARLPQKYTAQKTCFSGAGQLGF